MDTRTRRKAETKPAPPPEPSAPVVDPAIEAIERIKRRMPQVYAAVQEKAREIGTDAYQLVRRGARGEARCFYAYEAGVVVGTPWDLELPSDLAGVVAQFGLSMAIAWGTIGGEHGAH